MEQAAEQTRDGRTASQRSIKGLRRSARYRLDNRLSRGTAPVIWLLGLTTLFLVTLAGLFLWLAEIRVNGRKTGGIEGFWLSLLRTLDPGTMGSDAGWGLRITSLLVTLSGIFIVSTLIGLLANGIDQRVSDLRRGTSPVVERGHTLILGWSSKLPTLLMELEAAQHASQMQCVVILSTMDKVAMEDALHNLVPKCPRLRIVTRSGDPADPLVLPKVAPRDACSVVIFGDGESADAHVIRTVLALAAAGLPTAVPVVCELAENRRSVALRAASPLNLKIVVSHEWIARITARVCRTPSLAPVYQDLLDFDGAEIYFLPIDGRLNGRLMCDAVGSYVGGTVFGLVRQGVVTLAPDPFLSLSSGDQLIVLSETAISASYQPHDASFWMDNALTSDGPMFEEPDNIGVLGWSELGHRVLTELDQYLPPKSHVELVIDGDAMTDYEAPSMPYQRFELRYSVADSTNPEVLARLLADRSLDRLIVLASRGGGSSADADARVLLTVLELRQLLRDRPEVQVIVELLDPRNVELVSSGCLEEFIVGDRIVSLLMAQLAENGELEHVFNTLLAADGPEISLVPAQSIVPAGHTTRVGSVAQQLLLSGHYLLGIRQGGKVRLNLGPEMTFSVAPGDAFVVVEAGEDSQGLGCDPENLVLLDRA
jgi:ion channel POLLUX/CASTOR